MVSTEELHALILYMLFQCIEQATQKMLFQLAHLPVDITSTQSNHFSRIMNIEGHTACKRILW